MFAAIAGLVASSLFSYVASKAVTKWTGNETLGMIAGAAVGFGMGSYMSGAGKAVTATSSTGTGSTTTAGTNLMAGGEAAQFDIMSGGMAPSGSAAAEVNLFGDALTGGTGVAADATGGIMTSGISPAAQGVGEGVSAATESVQGGGLFDKLMGGGKKLTEYLGSAEGKSMIGKGVTVNWQNASRSSQRKRPAESQPSV